MLYPLSYGRMFPVAFLRAGTRRDYNTTGVVANRGDYSSSLRSIPPRRSLPADTAGAASSSFAFNLRR